MKTMTSKMIHTLTICVLSFSFVRCGGEGAASTDGQRITVDGQTITIEAPVLNLTGSQLGEQLTLNLTVIDDTYLVGFEIDRRVGSAPFELYAETAENTFVDGSLEDGTYTYRAIAVYEIDGQTYFSNYSEEVSKTIGDVMQEVDPIRN